MSLGAIFLVVLFLLLLGILPAWPHSATLSYYPASGVAFVIALIFVMVVGRRI